MSSNAFMSNQTPPAKTLRSFFGGGTPMNKVEYTTLSIKEGKEWCLASCDPLDLNKNLLYQLMNEAISHTENFTLTRTVGEDREGRINRIMHTKTTQEIKQIEDEMKNKEDIKRNGWV